jgi:hypothetical protein
MPNLKTATGTPFSYKRHPDGEVIVYTADEQGHVQSKSAIAITPYTIDIVKQAISRQGRVKVGPSRDNPPPGSLGALLKADGQSPQQLSYLVPILADQGYCVIIRDGRAIVVELRGRPGE